MVRHHLGRIGSLALAGVAPKTISVMRILPSLPRLRPVFRICPQHNAIFRFALQRIMQNGIIRLFLETDGSDGGQSRCFHAANKANIAIVGPQFHAPYLMLI